MYLLLGQLVYTSFAKRGFKTLVSGMVSIEIEQAFMERVSEYWDSYNPPTSDYRAVYLYQLSPEQTLFGWLYHDGTDDMGRSDVPLFVCYYLREPLFDFQLANIFTCLEKGPVGLIDRHNPSAYLETKVIPNLWSYQPARQGIAIPLAVRQHSYFALRQEELLNVFVPVYEQETVIDLNGQTYEQQLATLSIYTHYAIDGLNLDPIDLDDENPSGDRTAIQAYQSYKQKNRYTQALARKNQRSDTSNNTRNLLVKQKTTQPIKTLFNRQTVAYNTADNYTFTPKKLAKIDGSNLSPPSNKSANYDSVLAYQKTQLLLKIGIAASVLALAFGIYGLWQVSVSNSSYRDSISRISGTVKYNKLADVPNVPQGQFRYGGR